MFGPMRRRRQRGHTNWAGNQRCRPAETLRPRSAGELARAVADAHDRGLRVKAVGSGHSFTGTAMTTGLLVDVGSLARIETVDTDSGRAMVGAGITLATLNRELHRRGRALPNLGDIDAQTLAGATATGTHGTGLDHGNLSTGIAGLELVTGTGDLLWCDRANNADVFAAARVGIGALGIITRLAVETVPSFNLRTVESVEPVADLLADWSGFATSSEHPEFFWVPGTRRALVKRSDRTAADPSGSASTRRRAEKLLVENLAFGAAMRTVRRFPSTRDRVQRLVGSAATASVHVDASHRVFVTPRHVRFVEMEYGIPVDAVPEAFERVQALVAGMTDPPSFPIEVRVSGGDDIPLSTAQGRATGWIAVHRYRGLEYETYFDGVEAIMADYSGRPHWGKLHDRTAESLEPVYPRWAEFAGIRARTDPAGTFRNDYLDRVLGPDDS